MANQQSVGEWVTLPSVFDQDAPTATQALKQASRHVQSWQRNMALTAQNTCALSLEAVYVQMGSIDSRITPLGREMFVLLSAANLDYGETYAFLHEIEDMPAYQSVKEWLYRLYHEDGLTPPLGWYHDRQRELEALLADGGQAELARLQAKRDKIARKIKNYRGHHNRKCYLTNLARQRQQSDQDIERSERAPQELQETRDRIAELTLCEQDIARWRAEPLDERLYGIAELQRLAAELVQEWQELNQAEKSLKAAQRAQFDSQEGVQCLLIAAAKMGVLVEAPHDQADALDLSTPIRVTVRCKAKTVFEGVMPLHELASRLTDIAPKGKRKAKASGETCLLNIASCIDGQWVVDLKRSAIPTCTNKEYVALGPIPVSGRMLHDLATTLNMQMIVTEANSKQVVLRGLGDSLRLTNVLRPAQMRPMDVLSYRVEFPAITACAS